MVSRTWTEKLLDAGAQLRAFREHLRLSIRDVESASAAIAMKYGSEDFAIGLSRLSDIETKGVLPSIFRLYSLSIVYRRSFQELLSLYGVDPDRSIEDMGLTALPTTHVVASGNGTDSVTMPIRMDPGFDPDFTSNIGRFVQQWGVVPLKRLKNLATSEYTYGYIGEADLTMYPILRPGSFVQIDESRNKVVQGNWRSEYDRPIYFVETREEFLCCWCRQRGTEILAEPHPLSPVQPRFFKQGEAEILGQVVSVAMRLGSAPQVEPAPKARKQQT